MTTPQLPYPDFASAAGNLSLADFDANFAFLLGLFIGLSAAGLSFDDTIDLGAADVQAAIVALDEKIGIKPTLSLFGAPPAGGTVGDLYIFAPIVLGGAPPYTFGKGGSLPAEFHWNPTTGLLWAILSTPGTYSGLSITVTDAAGDTAQLAADPFTITVAATGSGGFFPDGSNLADVAATF